MFPFIAAAVVFALVIAGMAVGVIVSNREIKGSCGGLGSLCDACTEPCEEAQLAQAEAQYKAGLDVAPGRVDGAANACAVKGLVKNASR